MFRMFQMRPVCQQGFDEGGRRDAYPALPASGDLLPGLREVSFPEVHPLTSQNFRTNLVCMTNTPPLLPLLRSRVQGDFLALIYLHPDRDYSITEAAKAIHANVKTVYALAAHLIESGFIADSHRGNIHLVRAVTDSPISRPLTDLLMVTYGPLPVLTDLLRGVEGVEAAYIFGSWAARYKGEVGPVPNDVDVLVIGDPDRDDLYDIAEEARRRLGREVNPRIIPAATWASPPANDPFLKHVRTQPLVELKVTA